MSWQPIETAPKDGMTRVLIVSRAYREVLAAVWDPFDMGFWNVLGSTRCVGRGWPDFWMPMPDLPQ
jgi:hypothetical protein